MIRWPYYAALALLILLAGYSLNDGKSDAKAERQVRRAPVVTTVKSQRYRLGESEHMLLIDIPDRYVPRRCAVYVNEATRSTIMNCNFDSMGEPFPQAAEE